MKKYYGPPPRGDGKTRKREVDPFIRVFFHVPKYLYVELEKLAEERGLTVSRLVSYALFNESQTSNAFELDLTLPVDHYSPDCHAYEMTVLKDYLMKIPSGVSLDVLVILSPMIGLTRQELLLGYMALKEAGMIEEYKPKSVFIKYHDDYKLIRLKGVNYHEFQRERFITLEGQPVRRRKD